MGRLRKKRNHHGIRDIKRKVSTKNRVKDLDQIHEDLVPEKAELLAKQPFDLDLPGQGQHYCIECSRYFINDESLVLHTKSKVHRRRLKELKDGPYTQAEAEAAVGLKTDNGRTKAADV
ncbi:bud site selection-related protein, partial [Blastocladiella britannica]